MYLWVLGSFLFTTLVVPPPCYQSDKRTAAAYGPGWFGDLPIPAGFNHIGEVSVATSLFGGSLQLFP